MVGSRDIAAAPDAVSYTHLDVYKRQAVARAIAAQPPIVLADEPTGNLDTKSTKEIMEILKGLHKGGRTVIIITHDDEIAQQVNRVVRIIDGRIENDYLNEEREGA